MEPKKSSRRKIPATTRVGLINEDEIMDKCQRCRNQLDVLTMSYFNMQLICHTCEAKERNHPDFEKAREAESEACKRGDFDFPGIGLPEMLR